MSKPVEFTVGTVVRNIEEIRCCGDVCVDKGSKGVIEKVMDFGSEKMYRVRFTEGVHEDGFGSRHELRRSEMKFVSKPKKTTPKKATAKKTQPKVTEAGAFDIGQRVVLQKEYPNLEGETPAVGAVGTLIHMTDEGEMGLIVFDRPFEGGHDGGLRAALEGIDAVSKHSWWVPLSKEEAYLGQLDEPSVADVKQWMSELSE